VAWFWKGLRLFKKLRNGRNFFLRTGDDRAEGTSAEAGSLALSTLRDLTQGYFAISAERCAR